MAFNPNAFPEKSKPSGGGGSRMIADGKHRVTIEDVQWDGGRDQLVVTFSNGGGTIRGWYPVEGTRAFVTANLLRAVGWNAEFEPSDSNSRNHVLLGQELQIVVETSEYAGKNRTQVRWTNRLPGLADRSASDQPAPAPALFEDDDLPF